MRNYTSLKRPGISRRWRPRRPRPQHCKSGCANPSFCRPGPMRETRGGAKARLRRMRRRLQVWTKRHIPPGLRLLLGLILMVFGVLGFLPVVGFWMFPLGVAVAALDVVP